MALCVVAALLPETSVLSVAYAVPRWPHAVLSVQRPYEQEAVCFTGTTRTRLALLGQGQGAPGLELRVDHQRV